jgi:hypothetical protein
MKFCDAVDWAKGPVSSILNLRATDLPLELRRTQLSRAGDFRKDFQIFFLTIDLSVTLVQRHTLHCVHFSLDFVFQ